MVLNERLMHFIDVNNLLSENQAGFRKLYSTIDHVFLLKCIIDLCRFKRQKLYCAFIDYQKAFDSVWRDGLWYKLINFYSIKGNIINVIKSMYANTKSHVLVNGCTSQSFDCLVGVRQGENLSPLLFSLYINDLEEYLLENGNSHLDFKDAEINGLLKVFILLYADDTVILSNSEKGLQKGLDNM